MSKSFLALQYQRSMLAPVLADIETRGLQLDRELTSKRYAETLQRKEELTQQLFTLTGGINLGSNPQLATYIYDVLNFECSTFTGKGARSTSIGTIEELKAVTKEQKQFKTLYFEYNNVDQSLSKYLSLFKAIVDENDGLMFGSLNQGTVATHRLSSSGVPFKAGVFKSAKSCQFQNIPRDLKDLFVAHRKDWLIGEVDGSALEFRAAAGMAQDKTAINEIHNLVDIHAITADVMGTSRQDAKASTFRPLYGGFGFGKKEQDYCRFFTKKYATINKMQSAWCYEVMASPQRKLTTPYGLVFNFPNAKLDARGEVDAKRNIFNFPIQGFATGEVIPIALAHLWHNLPDGVVIVNTIHDSIVCEVRPDAVDAWRNACINSMVFATYEFLERVYDYKLDVPLGIGAKIGERWSKGDERTFQNENGTVYEIVKVNGKKEKVPYEMETH